MPNGDVGDANDEVVGHANPQSTSPSPRHLLESIDNEDQIKRVKKRSGVMFTLKGKQPSSSSRTGKGHDKNSKNGDGQAGTAQAPALRGFFRFGLGVISERGSLEA